jgi:TRAP-type mannitol/chloroaromatic compound transport system permease large subunit
MMDIGTISLILLVGLLVLLAIGMPLGLASAVMAVAVLVMKFEPALISDPLSFGDGLLTRKFGTGPLNILAQKIYGLLTDYVLISIPLFIFMAALLERSGIAKGMYTSLNVWLSGVRGGIAIVTSVMAVIMAAMSGIIGGEVVLLGAHRIAANAASWLQSKLGHWNDLRLWLARHYDPTFYCVDHLWLDHGNLD